MRNSTTIRLAAILFGLAGLWLAFTQQQPQPLTVTKIADDLHVIVGSGGNVGVYVTDEGVILVDDKFEQNVAEIAAKVKSITDKPIRYILNTHLHGDHTGGNARFLAAGAEIVAHENAARTMDERKMPGVPRLSFSQRFAVKLGGKRVEARHYGRGHTNTDAFMYFPDRKVVHTGDMFVSSAPFIDYSSGGSGVDWTRSIDRAMELDFDTVIPGHGNIMKREDLLKWKQNFEQMRLQISNLKKQGKSKDEAAQLAKIDSFFASPGMFVQRSYGGLWDELK